MNELVVEAARLTKSYQAGSSVVSAVSNISVSIRRGEFVAIVGRSGAGKSTLMSLLGLLERPDGGRYLFSNRDVGQLSEDERAAIRGRRLGFVFQLPALLARATALENIELPLAYAGVGSEHRRSRAASALARVGLSHRAQHWPHQLSGGEQQRVAVARAIVNDPHLILADEPTGALDSKTSFEILDLLQSLHSEGRTLVVVTHSDEVARRAQRVLTVLDGRILSNVTHDAPARSDGMTQAAQ